MWFYDVTADGWSLDDKRTPAARREKLGPAPAHDAGRRRSMQETTSPTFSRAGPSETDCERERARTEQSFCVPKADIVAAGYDLSLNRYREIVYEEVEHRDPLEIIAELETDRRRDPGRPGRAEGFSGLTPGWAARALGDVCEFRYGEALKAADRSGAGFEVDGSTAPSADMSKRSPAVQRSSSAARARTERSTTRPRPCGR